jgi:hypothetical protein
MFPSLKGYLGNKNIRPKGLIYPYQQWEIEEIIKCSLDIIYFAEKYVKIVSLDSGLHLVKLRDYQKEFLLACVKNRKVISMQARQNGKGMVVAIFLLWRSMFNEHEISALLANKISVAKETLKKFKIAYENLPTFLQVGIEKFNTEEAAFENGSRVIAAATTASGIRGFTITNLILDEYALVDKNIAEDFYTSVVPTISSGKDTKIIITSTPIGLNHFYHLYKGAENKVNGFVAVFADWTRNPDRNQAWADEEIRTTGEVKFNQEYACQFLGSSYTLINAKYIIGMAADMPITQDEHFKIYSHPQEKRVYLVAVDPAEGKNRDSSVIVVFDITAYPITIAAIYKNNEISPNLLPNFIYNFAKAYNEAFVLIENNNSPQVSLILNDELEYPNIISEDFHSKEFGIKMNKKVKRLGCINFKDIVEHQKIIINDIDLIAEITQFVQQNNGTYAADVGFHDDIVMACILMSWFATTAQFSELSNDNLRESLRQKNAQFLEDSMLPAGFYVPVIPNTDIELSEDQIELLNSINDEQRMMLKDMRMLPLTSDESQLLKSLKKQ